MAPDSFQSAWSMMCRLARETDEAYARLAELGKPSKLAVTKAKIYANRRWKAASAYIEKNFDAVLERMNVFYLPKALAPAAFVFPLRDLDGRWGQAQVRPFEDSPLFLPDHKYRRLGVPYAFNGPAWCGNDDETLRQVITKRAVTLVEGPFDILACKLLVRIRARSLSSLTKGVTQDHADYLRILGVNRINLMFDNHHVARGGEGEVITKLCYIQGRVCCSRWLVAIDGGVPMSVHPRRRSALSAKLLVLAASPPSAFRRQDRVGGDGEPNWWLSCWLICWRLSSGVSSLQCWRR